MLVDAAPEETQDFRRRFVGSQDLLDVFLQFEFGKKRFGQIQFAAETDLFGDVFIQFLDVPDPYLVHHTLLRFLRRIRNVGMHKGFVFHMNDPPVFVR